MALLVWHLVSVTQKRPIEQRVSLNRIDEKKGTGPLLEMLSSPPFSKDRRRTGPHWSLNLDSTMT